MTFQNIAIYIGLPAVAAVLLFACCSTRKGKGDLVSFQPSKNSCQLENYVIDPENRVVFNRQYFEEDHGRGKRRTHAWGYRYVVDDAIDFNTTCLYITYNQFVFKEHYKPEFDQNPPRNTNWQDRDDECRHLVGGWYCDGKSMVHRYMFDGTNEGVKNNPDAFSRGVPVAQISQFQHVDSRLLVDGVNFYSWDGREIIVIPIENLGIPVEITRKDFFY